jgi:hypothetical protein
MVAGVMDWIDMAQDRNMWRVVVNAVITDYLVCGNEPSGFIKWGAIS